MIKIECKIKAIELI